MGKGGLRLVQCSGCDLKGPLIAYMPEIWSPAQQYPEVGLQEVLDHEGSNLVHWWFIWRDHWEEVESVLLWGMVKEASTGDMPLGPKSWLWPLFCTCALPLRVFPGLSELNSLPPPCPSAAMLLPWGQPTMARTMSPKGCFSPLRWYCQAFLVTMMKS